MSDTIKQQTADQDLLKSLHIDTPSYSWTWGTERKTSNVLYYLWADAELYKLTHRHAEEGWGVLVEALASNGYFETRDRVYYSDEELNVTEIEARLKYEAQYKEGAAK